MPILNEYQKALTVEAIQACERARINPLDMAESFYLDLQRRINETPYTMKFFSREIGAIEPYKTKPYSIPISQDDTILSIAIKILNEIQRRDLQ